MKRRLKIYAIIVLVSMATYATVSHFRVEAQALAWHLRHGFHADMGGIRMRVPFSFQAEDPRGLPFLTMTRFDGHVWRGGGFVFIDFQQKPSPEARQEVEATLPNLEKRKRVAERAITFAGRPGTCIEYIRPITDSRLNKTIQAIDLRDIDCWFGDVGVEFIGTANLKEDVYDIIQAAEPIRQKN